MEPSPPHVDLPPTLANDARLFESLKQLLALDATTLAGTLKSASTVVADVLGAEKVDAFIFEPANQTLAAGVSDTPLARLQQSLGLDRLPLANGGRTVEVFNTGVAYHCGDVGADLGELPGIREALGIRSGIAVPLVIAGQRRGVLHVTSTRRDAFDVRDLEFLRAVTHWIGVAAHRAELIEELAYTAELQGRQAAAEELLVVFSHDLRNHLWTVSLRLHALRKRSVADGRAEDTAELSRIADNIGRLEQLSNDLLDVERLDRGLYGLRPAQIDAVALVRETSGLLAAAGAPIRIDAPDSLPLEADAAALRQALENLLSNARKHAPPDTAVLVTVREDPGPRIEILVRDFGPGIAPELLPRLFTRFIRGRGSPGLGLGLYLARKLIEAQGGTLDSVRPDGPGACFRIMLPVTSPQPVANI